MSTVSVGNRIAFLQLQSQQAKAKPDNGAPRTDLPRGLEISHLVDDAAKVSVFVPVADDGSGETAAPDYLSEAINQVSLAESAVRQLYELARESIAEETGFPESKLKMMQAHAVEDRLRIILGYDDGGSAELDLFDPGLDALDSSYAGSDSVQWMLDAAAVNVDTVTEVLTKIANPAVAKWNPQAYHSGPVRGEKGPAHLSITPLADVEAATAAVRSVRLEIHRDPDAALLAQGNLSESALALIEDV